MSQQTLGAGYERRTAAKESDIYYTPNDAIRSLLDCDRAPPMGIPFIEPAAGDGQIVRGLRGRGYELRLACEIREEELDILEVSASGGPGEVIIDDFLSLDLDLDGPSFVANPPFSSAKEFWAKCYSYNPLYMVFLLRMNTLGSHPWKATWDQFPPTFIRALDKRPSFTKTGRGNDSAEYAWIGYKEGFEPLDFRMV